MIEMLTKVYHLWIDNPGAWALYIYIYLLYFGNLILENLFEITTRGKRMLSNFMNFYPKFNLNLYAHQKCHYIINNLTSSQHCIASLTANKKCNLLKLVESLTDSYKIYAPWFLCKLYSLSLSLLEYYV